MNDEERIVNVDSIELNLTTSMVCSNFNRLCILYLLKKSMKNEMQAERIASNLGISHRTALYHLDILHDYDLVEVREFRKKGLKLLRSIWGLNSENKENLNKIFNRIKRKFDTEELEKMITLNNPNSRKLRA
ncbi:MAG: winged helix-turn-helix domain-containing protein [Candidatus Aenigmarchaeota archaeon]